MTSTKTEINQTSCARKADLCTCCLYCLGICCYLWKVIRLHLNEKASKTFPQVCPPWDWRIWLRFQSLMKSNGSPIWVCLTVTGSVTATSSHTHLCQEEKLSWYSELCGRQYSGISPVYCHSISCRSNCQQGSRLGAARNSHAGKQTGYLSNHHSLYSEEFFHWTKTQEPLNLSQLRRKDFESHYKTK